MNVLNTTLLQAVAFVLFLIALPLLSVGTVEEQELLWYAGLAMIVIAGVLPPLGRFVGQPEDDEEDEADEADEPADDEPAADQEVDDADPEPSAGPIGPSTGATGREARRARVEEQRERAKEDDQ